MDLAASDLIALAALITSAAALWASWSIARAEGRRTSLTTYFQLLHRYESRPIAAARRKVTSAVLNAGTPDEESVTTILNAFEYVGASTRREIVEDEVVWIWIGDRAVAYWWALTDFIAAWKAEDPTYYAEFAWLIDRLRGISRRHGSLMHDGVPPQHWIERILRIDGAEAKRSVRAN